MGMKTEYEMDSLLRQIKQEGTMEEAAKRLSETLIEAALGPMQACLEKPSAQTFLALEETLAYLARYAPFMEYEKYRQKGYPSGSGATESAMRLCKVFIEISIICLSIFRIIAHYS